MFVAFELVFRESFVLVLVPLCAVLLCTEVYRPTKGMGARAVRLLIVTIAAKPIIALCLAVGAVASASRPRNVGQRRRGTGSGPARDHPSRVRLLGERQLPGCVIGRERRPRDQR